MNEMISKVLHHVGYAEIEPTEQNLFNVFLEQVAYGAFLDLNLEDAQQMIEIGDITIKGACYNLLRLHKH